MNKDINGGERPESATKQKIINLERQMRGKKLRGKEEILEKSEGGI